MDTVAYRAFATAEIKKAEGHLKAAQEFVFRCRQLLSDKRDSTDLSVRAQDEAVQELSAIDECLNILAARPWS